MTMSHHWLHLAHAASHIIKHLVDHSKKHAATTEHAAPPAQTLAAAHQHHVDLFVRIHRHC